MVKKTLGSQNIEKKAPPSNFNISSKRPCQEQTFGL